MKKILFLFLLCSSIAGFSQTTVSGKVVDENGDGIPGLIVKVLETKEGTSTDVDGNYVLTSSQAVPFTVQVTGIGFEPQKMTINSADTAMGTITMKELDNELQQVVISASRVPEKLFESPVSIEQLTTKDIANSSSATFYDGLENLKGVDVTTSSFTFKSVNTRGFATVANTRFVQLIDGMDNASPALNFPLGNLLGMSELDVERVEILPGASSALYGANAFNGIMFMTSKSPFTHQGFSAYGKTGLQSHPSDDSNLFTDLGLRYGHKFSDKVAAKVSVSRLQGEEWRATDYNDYDTGAANRMNTDYNGLNTYGDEVATTLNFRDIALANNIPAPIVEALGLGAATVSRTGYAEQDLMDYDARSLKADVAVHIRPKADDLELILNSKFGRGNTIYQGANRYSIKNFENFQHKIELRSDNFFVRGYMITEDAGDSYDSRFTAINVNRSWKSDQQWFQEYAAAYLGGRTGQIPNVGVLDDAQAHALARQAADAGRYLPGTSDFNNALNNVTSNPDLSTGSKFVDKTKLYHMDANYNFMNQIEWADIQVGGSWRQYGLDSGGTIFTDKDGVISYNEYGLYTQLQKRFANDKLKFTGSVRYDKSELFDGFLSPRVSFVYSPDEEKKHNFRASYQTGFRNPTTQDLYIGLDAGRAILVGSAQDNLTRFLSNPLLNSQTAQFLGFPSSVQLDGNAAYNNSYTLSSLQAFGASAAAGTPNPGLLQVATPDLVKPEKVTAYEVGYRGALGNHTFLDASVYFNNFEDFIANQTVIAPHYGNVDFSDVHPVVMQPNALIAIANGDYQPFQTYTNSNADVNSKGFNIGLHTLLFNDYDFGVNYSFADFDYDENQDPNFRPGFNSPKHRVKAQFGNEELFNNLGFNANWRWNDAYEWQSSFVDATIPARSIVDAQVNYNLKKSNTMIKLGAANLLNYAYESMPGAGTIGAQYYIGFTYNN